MKQLLSDQQVEDIEYRVLPKAYNPSGPISRKDMFKGRAAYIDGSLEAIFQPDQHLVIIGERGVGKTSLANIIYDLITDLGTKIPNYWYGKVNCGTRETFASLWNSAFRNVRLTRETKQIGFTFEKSNTLKESTTLGDSIPSTELSPSRIVTIVKDKPGVWIFDEFNMLPRVEAQPFADLIKALSDAGSKAKIVLVGVAESVAALIEDHRSVDRNIRQILMPRMDSAELLEIIHGAETITGMKYSEAAQNIIINLSQGLPYFTHQLGLCSAKAALTKKKLNVATVEVKTGIEVSLSSSEESLKEAYRRAIYSRKPNAMYKEVLLACAIAEKDPFGYFKMTDVVDPLSRIRQKKVVPGAFAAHLASFCSDNRGSILLKKGSPQNYVYRFVNPLLQPYTIMHGISEGSAPQEWIRSLEKGKRRR